SSPLASPAAERAPLGWQRAPLGRHPEPGTWALPLAERLRLRLACASGLARIVLPVMHPYKAGMSTAIPFHNLNGLGHAIVLVDLRGSSHVFSAGEARSIARRPASRFEQLMVLHAPRTPGTEAFVRIYNADGSEAEACGNGMRCVGFVVAQQ